MEKEISKAIGTFADKLVDLICIGEVSTISVQTVIRLIEALKLDMLEDVE